MLPMQEFVWPEAEEDDAMAAGTGERGRSGVSSFSSSW